MIRYPPMFPRYGVMNQWNQNDNSLDTYLPCAGLWDAVLVATTPPDQPTRNAQKIAVVNAVNNLFATSATLFDLLNTNIGAGTNYPLAVAYATLCLALWPGPFYISDLKNWFIST
jgi:hypothetical protein